MSCDEESRNGFIASLASQRGWSPDQAMALLRSSNVAFKQGAQAWDETQSERITQWQTTLDGVANQIMTSNDTPRKVHKGQQGNASAERAGYSALVTHLADIGVFTEEQLKHTMSDFQAEAEKTPDTQQKLEIYRQMLAAQSVEIHNQTGLTLSDEAKQQLLNPMVSGTQPSVPDQQWGISPDTMALALGDTSQYDSWPNPYDIAHDMGKDDVLRAFDRADQQQAGDMLRNDATLRAMTLRHTYNQQAPGSDFATWLETSQTLYGSPPEHETSAVRRTPSRETKPLIAIDTTPSQWLGAGLQNGQVYLDSSAMTRRS